MEQPAVSAKLTGFLAFNAGYVDTAGFLALNGLFTAHVTGNFVTLGASLVHGATGALAKLLALPVFCLLVFLSRLGGAVMLSRQRSPVSALLFMKAVFLTVAAGLLIVNEPSDDQTAWSAILGGMLLVAAMAIQNAVQRMYLPSAPPSTLMTGTTTQVMIDLADLLGGAPSDIRQLAIGRLRKLVPAIVTFASGCAIAALIYAGAGTLCFALPPVIAASTLFISIE